MKNNEIKKNSKALDNKSFKITNKRFLKISIFIAILVIIGPFIGLIIININKIDFHHDPFNKQVIIFNDEINKKIFKENNHEFSVSPIKGEQNYLNQKQVSKWVNDFNNKTLAENLSIFSSFEQKEFLQKLELSKFNSKIFYQELEIAKLQMLPIKFSHSKINTNDIYGLVDLEVIANNKYNIYYKYLYQVVIYEVDSDKPIILKKRPFFQYHDANISTEQLLSKANVWLGDSRIDSFIINFFISTYKYDNAYAYFISRSGNVLFIKYDSKKINNIMQLDAFKLKNNSSFYNKIINLKINFTVSNIIFDVKSLPPYVGQKQSDQNSETPKFSGNLKLTFNEHLINIAIEVEPYLIIIPESKKEQNQTVLIRERY